MNLKMMLVIGSALAAFSGTAGAAIITFDSMGVQGSTTPNPGGFALDGYTFSNNMDVVDVSSSGNWWSNGVGANHSGKYAALNDWGGDMFMTQVGGGTFSVENLSLNGWQGSSYQTLVQGLYNGSVVASIITTIGSPWLNVATNFSNIDTLRISGGIFLVDDISVNSGNPSAVPLPAALPLMLSGLGILGFASRRRKEIA